MNSHKPGFTTPPSIIKQITDLPTLSIADVKALWLELFGTPTTTPIRSYLERRIAYKLQENEFRKVNPELLERNAKRITALIKQEQLKKEGKSSRSEYQFVPGTIFTREYHRVEYSVVVTNDNQFEFQGRLYKSLSVIAREITGTRWSGPLFFGLKIKMPRKPKTKNTKGVGR